MATRNKHIRTPYEDERKKHRAAASRSRLNRRSESLMFPKGSLIHGSGSSDADA